MAASITKILVASTQIFYNLPEVEGYEFHLAENGQKVLDLLQTVPYQALLMDIRVDTKYIVMLRHQFPRLPVIIITPLQISEAFLQDLGKERNFYFLPQPNTSDLLKACLDSSIENPRLRREQDALMVSLQQEKKRADDLQNIIIPLGVALAREDDFNRMLEEILTEAMSFCNADAGTIYIRTEEDFLTFELVVNKTLHLALGGTSGDLINFPPLRMYDQQTGQPVHDYVVTHSALTGELVNIPDAYADTHFHFSGTHQFDARTGYRSTSFLTIPLKNPFDRVIGILQLINAKDSQTSQVIPFNQEMERMISSMSLLAAVALEAYKREQALRLRISALQIEIDRTKAERQVAEITETEYFQKLQQRVQGLRKRRKTASS